MKHHIYKEQLERVRRWYERFQEISEGKLHERSSDFYEDDVYAFFQNCYHLEDWIKHDPAAGPLSAQVEDFINQTPELLICADICNSLKHLKLKRSRSSQTPEFGKRIFKLSLGTKPTTIAVAYTIDTNAGTVDAFDLASQCLRAWEKFVTFSEKKWISQTKK